MTLHRYYEIHYYLFGAFVYRLAANTVTNVDKMTFIPVLVGISIADTVEISSPRQAGVDWLNWWISLVCLNPCLGTSGANGEQRQGSACPIAPQPPVGAIMGNTERHSFNFILSTVPATLYNIIISSRSAGSSDRAMLSRHWGNAN